MKTLSTLALIFIWFMPILSFSEEYRQQPTHQYLSFPNVELRINKTHRVDTNYFTVLKLLEEGLNDKIPSFKFISDQGIPANFLIADLTDSSNKSKVYPGDNLGFINFVPGHFYHVVPALRYKSFSFIVYFKKNGKLKIFNYVNCPEKGDGIEEVIKYARKRLGTSKGRDGVINNIKNYRASVTFLTPTDNYGNVEPNCNFLR
jgi:hypothetical protein